MDTRLLRNRYVVGIATFFMWLGGATGAAVDPMEELKSWAQSENLPIVEGGRLSVQTGRYGQVVLGKKALNGRCMSQIVKAAYTLHRHFPDYNFVIESHIQHCQNLQDGVRRLIAEKEVVKKNLKSFHSPLHSVFLTNRSRFNHYVLGEMGLHINVNQKDEIKRRLIDFEIAETAIPHQLKPRTVSRL